MSKNANIETYQLIANILNFNDEDNRLQTQLENCDIDWENLVKLASTHLVLTTVYCRLKQKDLLNYLPNDLEKYLEELTSINRNRNKKLIEEAKIIISIIDHHAIDYVFIKGMALLLGGYYKDLGERMIGDFDILIQEEDINKTFDILKREGYNKLIDFNYNRPKFRHLPRQVNDNKLAAIELHRHVLNPSHRGLISVPNVFKDKCIIENIVIPSWIHLKQINVLTSELNDKNYFYNTINLKHSYDSLVLKLDNNVDSNTKHSNSNYVYHYLSLNSIWFNQFKPKHIKLLNQIKKKTYLQKIRYKPIDRLINTIKFTYINVTHRLNLVLNNKSYRQYLIKSLILRKT